MIAVSSPREKRLAYFAWLGVCIIWGTTYVSIRITLETMPPFLMAAFRWLIAAALLVIYMKLRGEPLPPRTRWGGIALMGFLLLVIGNGGVVYAEQWVASGLAAVMVATSPFWMGGVEASLGGERVTGRMLAGLLVGFTGILVLVWPELTIDGAGGGHFLLGVVALQLAAFGWALGSAYSRRYARQDHVLGTTALQMLAGGVMLLVAGTAHGEWPAVAFSTRSTIALAYLSTLGAIGGFVAYTYALRHLPMSFVSLYAYINPIIAVALGILILGEPFDLRIGAAAALVLIGVAIVRSQATAAQPAQPAPTVDRSGGDRQKAGTGASRSEL